MSYESAAAPQQAPKSYEQLQHERLLKDREKKRKKKLKEKKEKSEKERVAKKKAEKARKEAQYKKNSIAEKKFFSQAFKFGYMIGRYLVEKLGRSKIKEPDTTVRGHGGEYEYEHDHTETPEGSIAELEQTLSWSETPPASDESADEDYIGEKLEEELVSFGVPASEGQGLSSDAAWNLLQQKKNKRDIEDLLGPKVSRERTPREIQNDFGVLRKTWETAFLRMGETSGPERALAILTVTSSVSDPNILEEYLKREGETLSAEERFFIGMSAQIKAFKMKAAEVIAEAKNKKPGEQHDRPEL